MNSSGLHGRNAMGKDEVGAGGMVQQVEVREELDSDV